MLFIRKIFDWMRHWKHMGKVIVRMEKKAENKAEEAQKQEQE